MIPSDRGLAIVTPLVQVDAGNAQRFWEALASVGREHSIIVVDLTWAWTGCSRYSTAWRTRGPAGSRPWKLASLIARRLNRRAVIPAPALGHGR